MRFVWDVAAAKALAAGHAANSRLSLTGLESWLDGVSVDVEHASSSAIARAMILSWKNTTYRTGETIQ